MKRSAKVLLLSVFSTSFLQCLASALAVTLTLADASACRHICTSLPLRPPRLASHSRILVTDCTLPPSFTYKHTPAAQLRTTWRSCGGGTEISHRGALWPAFKRCFLISWLAAAPPGGYLGDVVGAEGVDEFVEVLLAVGGVLAGQLLDCVAELWVEPPRLADSVAVGKKPTHNSHKRQQQQNSHSQTSVPLFTVRSLCSITHLPSFKSTKPITFFKDLLAN